MTRDEDDEYQTVRIPAIDKDDPVLGPLTARQALSLAVLVLVIWGGYLATRSLLSPLAYLAMTAPPALVIAVLVLGRRDGVSLDRLALAGLRHTRAPKRLAPPPQRPSHDAPPAWIEPEWARQAGPTPAPLHLPAQDISDAGAVDLGTDGHAAVAACSTVNFALRTSGEQRALVSAFGRWLNSLSGPAQLLIRAQRMDLAAFVARLRANAPALPHRSLEEAALAHAAFVEQLAGDSELLVRQVLLVQREGGRQGAGRAVQRTYEAARALAPASVNVAALDAERAREAIAAAANPARQTPGTARVGAADSRLVLGDSVNLEASPWL